MDKIARVRQEIERLKGICTAQIKVNPGQTFPFVMEMTGYDKLLSFLNTLSEEPNKSLEEVAEEFAEGEWDGAAVDTDGNPLYAQDEIEYAFKAGAEWQREDMLKDAEEGMVTINLANHPVIWLDQLKGFRFGEKVRIIVLKDNENESK